MGKAGDLALRLHSHLLHDATGRIIVDIRVGATYLAVRLDDGRVGLSAVPRADIPPECPPFPPQATLIGSGAASTLAWLIEKGSPRKKAIALATANALIRQDRCDAFGDAFARIGMTPADRVVMVGRFQPLVERIAATGASLTILEKDEARGLVLGERERREVLQEATLALITATTLLYDSLEEILDSLGGSRHNVLLGPSTPMLPDIFTGTPIHHLGGVRILDVAGVLRIVSAGGGTRSMRPYLETTNLYLENFPKQY